MTSIEIESKKEQIRLIRENSKLRAQLADARKKIHLAAAIIDSAVNIGSVRREEATQGLQILWNLHNRLRTFASLRDAEVVQSYRVLREQVALPGLPLPTLKREVLKMFFDKHFFAEKPYVRTKI